MEKPSPSQAVEFRTENQVLYAGEDLSLDQAIAIQVKSAILNDERTSTLDDSCKGFLQGVAASIAVMNLRNEGVLEQLPLITRAIIEDDMQRSIIETAIKFVSNVGPARDLVLKPVRFFVLVKGFTDCFKIVWTGKV